MAKVKLIDEDGVVIRPADDGRLDEYFMAGPRSVHIERMCEDAWVVVAYIDEKRTLYGSFFVKWRWRNLEPDGWKRFIWFPWPHIEGIAEIEK